MTTEYDRLREARFAKLTDEQRQLLQFPDLVALGVAGVRQVIEDGNRTMPVTPGVDWRDVEVMGPHGLVPVRIFEPRNTGGPLPIVVHTHSGGFIAGGGFDQWNGFDSAIAAGVPALVVHPDFRLPPEDRFPIGLEESWAVLRWAAAGGVGERADTSKIAVGGGCTGGNMAAVLALMARDAGAPQLALQFLESWPSDLRNDSRSQYEFADGYGLRKSDGDFVTSAYLADPEDRWEWRASPLLAESMAAVAPALITVGDWDILRDEDVQYANRLRDAGVPVELHVDPERGHPGDPQVLMARLVDALRRALGSSVGTG
ncbi:alpha/beta hydrolase [uncultured Amnibacterium sp.]|uniref:alpha/beta hydrolase n=1 Tax=uncultured Amnibacterium sp. TaxID=1631851 RepID=UPI0035C9FBAB